MKTPIAKSKLRVLQIVPSYYPALVYGGPIFSIHNTCQMLARLGIDVRVATTNANGESKLDVDTAEAVDLESNYSVRYYDDTIIGRFSIDFTINLLGDIKAANIVHLQDVFSTYAVVALLLTSLLHKPLLISTRGTFTQWGLTQKRPFLKKVWLRLLVSPFVRSKERIAWHATSLEERNEILDQFPEARVYIVPNGIDCRTFDSLPIWSKEEYLAKFCPEANAAGNSTSILIAMGRLHLVKGFDIAIKALQIVAKEESDIILLIAGGDDGAGKVLNELIQKLNLGERVKLIGALRGEEKIAFLKGATILLFPSYSENFGMVCLESLAAGTPVVVSCKTPWAEVDTLESGMWVDHTPSEFAKAISTLLAKDRLQLRKAARLHAERYNIVSVAMDFNRIYRELVDRAYAK